MSAPVLENALIERMAGRFLRSPHQLNRLQESDAELVRLPGGPLLALTTDSLVEEITSGLYDDPWLIGWMTVIVNASDLAAVGASPVGILLNQTLPAAADAAWLERLQAGIDAASRAAALPVLGGDVNTGDPPQMGATALGIVDGPPLTRRGARPGDRLFASGRLGAGASYALARPAPGFPPAPRLQEGRILARFATAAIDTSDGLLPALDQLSRLNGTGFTIDAGLENILVAEAAERARAASLPEWMLLAGPHGEFELVFTLPSPAVAPFLSAARSIGWEPVALGAVTATEGIRLHDPAGTLLVDTAGIRNLAYTAGTDIERYIAGLERLARKEA
jgi:thiamine-monophosphate kinase